MSVFVHVCAHVCIVWVKRMYMYLYSCVCPCVAHVSIHAHVRTINEPHLSFKKKNLNVYAKSPIMQDVHSLMNRHVYGNDPMKYVTCEQAPPTFRVRGIVHQSHVIFVKEV